MKKTFITLLALTGMAVGEDYTGTFAWSATSDPSFSFTEGMLKLDVDSIVSTQPGSTVESDAAFKSSTINWAGNDYRSTLNPDTNVGNGGTWKATFTLSNTGNEAIELDSITLNAFAFANSGAAQNAGTETRKISFSITGAFESTLVHDFSNKSIDGESVQMWDTNPTLSLQTPVLIGAEEQITFTLTVTESDSVGTYVGLSGATFSVRPIPEPATATLSLLALAGLAVRRRRK